MFHVTNVCADAVHLMGPADADDPHSPWVLEVPVVEGSIAENFISTRGGPVRLMSTDERRAAVRAARDGYAAFVQLQMELGAA
jgi:hypothetical protein